MAVTGSCLCGSVRYEVSGPLGEAGHCHCTMCRKAHGAAFGSYARVAPDDFRFTAGADQVRAYESSPGTRRTFCGRCGSTLQFVRQGRPHFGLALGTVDGDPGVRPSYEIWLSERAPWFEPGAELRGHPTQPGA